LSEPRELRDLGPAGRKLRRDVLRDMAAAELEFDAREQAMLHRCARMADRIAAMDRELEGADLLVPGYLGKGTVSNPLLTELRQTEALLAQTLTRLKPQAPEDESQSVRVPRSVAARAAANTRWSRR
jgi:hypothetical protein